jgi:hypothetical protein
MANLTFLGIENPLGVLGVNVRGVLLDAKQLDPLKDVTKGINASDYALRLNNKLDFRANQLSRYSEVQNDMVDDTVENRDYVLKLLSNRRHPDVRVAMCSSLNSTLKHLANYCVNHPGDKFDTVIIHGHGAPGGISLGLGQVSVGPPLSPGDPKYADRKEIREAFGLDRKSDGEKPVPWRIRELSMENTDIWTEAFQAIKAHVEVSDDTGYFHLFLVGCKVGKTKAPYSVTLQQAAAKVLGAIINEDVCISAPEETITDGHLDNLLDRIVAIRKKCAMGKQVSLNDEGKDPVLLTSCRS